jgi:transposase
MLGRRQPQRSLFDATSWPHQVPPDSFYGRMAAVHDVLFADDDLAAMYCLDNGRPSLPPSLLCGVLVLQFYDNASDEEAVARLRFDLRWKVALGVPLDYAGFDPSSLVVFRQRLLTYAKERYAFERFLTVAREAGFLPPKLRLLLDSSPQKGAGAVQDTYTLLRKGMRRLLKAMGFSVPEKRRGLALNLARYLESDRKSAIDWSDPQARAAELAVLVADADAVLTLASEHTDDPDVRATGWLLTKILGDDVVTGQGGAPELGEGVARDRIISWTDPQMRHGRKSAAGRWNGGKVQVATDAASELITAIEVEAANAGDGATLLPLVAATEAATEAVVEAVTADTAYGAMANQVACAEQGIDLVAPVPTSGDPAVGKEAFTLGADGASLTCPEGQTSMDWREVKDADGREVKQFHFARMICEACPLFARCVHSATNGRTVTLHYYEDELRAARARQETAGFRENYRQRAAIERKIAELMQQGLREARYVGREKQRVQALWTAATVNLKRIFRRTAGDPDRLAALLAGRPVDRAVPVGVPG